LCSVGVPTTEVFTKVLSFIFLLICGDPNKTPLDTEVNGVFLTPLFIVRLPKLFTEDIELSDTETSPLCTSTGLTVEVLTTELRLKETSPLTTVGLLITAVGVILEIGKVRFILRTPVENVDNISSTKISTAPTEKLGVLMTLSDTTSESSILKTSGSSHKVVSNIMIS